MNQTTFDLKHDQEFDEETETDAIGSRPASPLPHVPDAEHPVCRKCKLYQNCETPFQRGWHWDGHRLVEGEPRDASGYVLVLGEAPDPFADNPEYGNATQSDDFSVIHSAVEKLGVEDQFWYHPTVMCRASETAKRKEGRFTATEIKRCFGKHVKPLIEYHQPRAILAVGAVASAGVLGSMDARGMENQWHVTNGGIPTYAMRGVADMMLVNDQQSRDEFVNAFRFAFEHEMSTVVANIDYLLARTADEVYDWFEPVVAHFLDAKERGALPIPLSWDTETSSVATLWKGKEFRVCLWSFYHPSAPGDIVMLIPTPEYACELFTPEQLAAYDEILDVLKPIMESETVKKVGHNSQYDENAVWSRYGWKSGGFMADTMIWDFLHNSEEKRHALDLLCIRYLPNVPRYWEALEKWITKEEMTDHGYCRVPKDILYPYAAWDTKTVLDLYLMYLKTFQEQGKEGAGQWGGFFMSAADPDRPDLDTLKPLEYALHCRSVHHRMCAHLERHGVSVDRELVSMIRDHYVKVRDRADAALKSDPDVVRFETEILPGTLAKGSPQLRAFKKFGEPIRVNWASAPQVKRFFIDFLELPILSLTDAAAPCLDAANVAKYATHHKCAPAARLNEWRKAEKFITSFINPLVGANPILRDDGLIHPQYKPAATATGRLACSGGYNMQAMPRDGAIKKIFNSRWKDGWIGTRDYSGIEVRVLAAVSQDPTLCAAFREGRDPHFVTQQFFFREKADAKNKTQRSICKRALFGRLYGQGDKGLFDLLTSEAIISQDTGEPITLDECQVFNQLIDQLYPAIANWVRLAHEQAIGNHFCCSPFGFVRPLPGAKLHHRLQQMQAGMSWDDRKKDKKLKRVSAMVAEAMRHAQNSPIQSAASDLTVMASYVIQRRLDALDVPVTPVVVGVVHDDIWVDIPNSELVPAVMAIMADVMDNPVQWLPELLPGLDCSWINIPIIGEAELGLSPKDAFGLGSEPTFGHPLDPNDDLSGDLTLVVDKSYVETYGFLGAVDKDEKKSVIPFSINSERVREALAYKRLNLE